MHPFPSGWRTKAGTGSDPAKLVRKHAVLRAIGDEAHQFKGAEIRCHERQAGDPGSKSEDAPQLPNAGAKPYRRMVIELK